MTRTRSLLLLHVVASSSAAVATPVNMAGDIDSTEALRVGCAL
ncbi:MAG TPA: hypothetical protein VH107_06190 [Lacipirellulaceae bacterium]|nr:hypothetical protein [Lacipirellulaceae bacterium]